jgi:hypothetical protein
MMKLIFAFRNFPNSPKTNGKLFLSGAVCLNLVGFWKVDKKVNIS